jgi:hypothetical protein
MKVSVLLVCLGGLALACGDSEPTVAYHYEVRGDGDNVVVRFVTEDGLHHETVTLPWASEEFLGTEGLLARIEADGPLESRVKCVVRYRPIDGVYGGNRSGESSQFANRPEEDRTLCALDQVLP